MTLEQGVECEHEVLRVAYYYDKGVDRMASTDCEACGVRLEVEVN